MILAVESGRRESTESWRTVVRDLEHRDLQARCVVIGDGNLGIRGALPAAELKRVPGRSGVTSNQSTVWHVLRLLRADGRSVRAQTQDDNGAQVCVAW